MTYIILFLVLVSFFLADFYLREYRRIIRVCDLYQKKFVAEAKLQIGKTDNQDDLKLIKFFMETFNKKKGEACIFYLLKEIYERRVAGEPRSPRGDGNLNDLINYWTITLAHRSPIRGFLIRSLLSQLFDPKLRTKFDYIVRKEALSLPNACALAN